MSLSTCEFGTASILSLKIAEEQDVVTARQRARQLASLLAFPGQDQVRIATAVSEIARNVHQYAGEGILQFSLDLHSRPQVFWMCVRDRGPGIPHLSAILSGQYESQTGMGIGLLGTRRLMDHFEVESQPGQQTIIRFGKSLPPGAAPLQQSDLATLHRQLAQQRTSNAVEELQRQNRDLLQTLELLRLRETELEKRQHELSLLNLELEETNRGVVALYGELDEKAVALRRADEMKSRFLRHVSHEFRTPLNAIQALTRLLLEHTDGPLAAEQEKQVTYIRKAAGELTEMVNDLLDLAKVESGRAELRLSLLDVGQLLGGVRALMRPLAANEAVKLVFEEPAQPLSLTSDESKVSQILRNLISNALKFTTVGQVRVSAHSAQDGAAVAFVVKDTGIGVAPEDLDRIFQEFAQIENSLQRTVKGTGLGLPLSRKLAGLLGGTLEVASELGSGSTFTLTLPGNARFPTDAPILSPGDGSSTPSILLIDDDEASRYVTRQLFAGARHHIIEAASGSEGAERARFDRPALIVLDLSLPDRSGFEVLEELKSHPTTREIPVVIHSSQHLRETDDRALSNNVLAVLPKGSGDRLTALLVIRKALREPGLFVNEPEFKQGRKVI